MVGEIRDHETAEISIHAALTGHLVFSTLHTNDAPGSITRMLDMGVEPYLVASSLIGAVAQRLVRRLCPVCSAPDTPTDASLRAIGVSQEMAATATFRRGAGCDKCQNTGYKGRQALYELFHVDEPIRRMTVERANSTQLRDHAIAAYGMRTLLGDGRLSVMDGKTTPEEVLRVCQRDGL
jgi:type II secretory ATPase GspE/PulE/Tfp pilus assembly ATPase PilB-like protein